MAEGSPSAGCQGFKKGTEAPALRCLAGCALEHEGYRRAHRPAQDEAAFGVDGKWDFWLYPVASNHTIIGQSSHVA